MHLPSTSVLLQVAVIGLLTGGVYALMAAGLTLIFGVMKVINIAHGAFLVLSGYIAYWLFTLYALDPLLSVVVSVPLFFVLGMGFQRFALARIKNEPGLVVLLTFSLALVLEGIMATLWESTGRSVRTWYTANVVIMPIGDITFRLPWVRIGGFVLAVIALGALYLLLSRSNLGRGIRATIQNRSTACRRECRHYTGCDLWDWAGDGGGRWCGL